MLIIDRQIYLWSKGSPPPHHRQASHWTAAEALRERAQTGAEGMQR